MIRKNRAGYCRDDSLEPTRVEYTTVKNKLPEVGSRVIVREYVVLTRSSVTLNVKEMYRDHPNYYDALGNPKIFTVLGYAKGIDNPLDVNNYVTLEYITREGIPLKERIKTLPLSTGCMMLCVVDESQIVKMT